METVSAYMSAKEAAEKWRVHIRVVQAYCKDGRIPGAKKYGVGWMIPFDAQKPVDPRRARKLAHAELAQGGRASCVFLTSAPLPKGDPESALLHMEEALRPLAAADIAFRRGDPEPAKALWRETPRDGACKLSAASLATAAAISSGDYALYDEIQRFLQVESQRAQSRRDKALLSLPGTLAAVSMAAPEMTPDWLTGCDFSLFPDELRPFLLYLYAMQLRNTGAYAQLLGVAKATLALQGKHETFTWLDVYLLVLCAVAENALGDAQRAGRYLEAALALSLPYGFIAPFADHLGALGGTLDSALERARAPYGKSISALWERSFKNWMRFHNAFAKDHITTVLTAQEYQIARLIAHGATYADAARRMNLSVSRVKNILAEVYAKLCVQGKQELPTFIL